MPKSKASPEPKTGKRAWLEDRTYQEDGSDPDAEVLRELGHGLIPSNGDGQEVQD